MVMEVEVEKEKEFHAMQMQPDVQVQESARRVISFRKMIKNINKQLNDYLSHSPPYIPLLR